MSVVVRMEMPNGCHDCKLRNMIGNCPIPMFDGQDEEKIWTLAECFQRPPWCPIVCSLPEGHGRLVDADACAGVLRKLENEAVKPTENLCFGYAAKMFEEAFTIVPAEEERRKQDAD